MSEEQGYKDLSQEARDVEELIPDRWFYSDKLKGVKLRLKVASVLSDDGNQELVITFANDERWLRTTRKMRLILKDRFGLMKGWVGKSFTITALPNWKQQYFVEILPEELEEPVTIAIDKPAPKAKRKRRSTDEVNDK